MQLTQTDTLPKAFAEKIQWEEAIRMLAIYKRELKSYFQSMVGCVFVAFLVAFTGIYFMAYT